MPRARLGRLFSLIQEEIQELGEKCSHFWYVLLIRSLTDPTFRISRLAVRTRGVLKKVSYWEGPSEVQPLTLL